jgi:hypothetical protein
MCLERRRGKNPPIGRRVDGFVLSRIWRGPSRWQQTNDFALRRESVSKSSCELAVLEAVVCIQFLSCLNQLRELVRYVFDLAKLSFLIFLCVPYEYGEEIALRPDEIMGIDKITENVLGVEASIGAREEHHVVTRFIRAINNRRFLSKPVEKLPAVSTLIRVSRQGTTACTPGIEETVTEPSANGEEVLGMSCPLRVPKSLFPAASQLYETAGAPNTVSRVRKSLHSRTVVAG